MFAHETSETSPTVRKPESKFFDAGDGWLDVSGFLDTAYGFVPIATLVTEPAVAYGAAGWLIFIDRNPPTSDGDPSVPTWRRSRAWARRMARGARSAAGPPGGSTGGSTPWSAGATRR